MVWFWSRSGWRRVRGERFTVELPAAPRRTAGDGEAPRGAWSFVTRVAKAPDSASCHVTLRQGPAIEASSDTELFHDWREEFLRAMADNGLATRLVAESPRFDLAPEVRLEFRSDQGTVTLARLIREPDRLVILVAIGATDIVARDAERLFQSYSRR